MTTDTLISRIQLRRGTFEQLPILKEGELGYAMDVKRLFIGNPSQAFVADDSPYYDLTIRIARPSQILVFVDNTQKTPGVHYTVVGTRLTFNNPQPTVGAIIEVGVNNEVLIDRVNVPTEILPIMGSSLDEFTGIFFDYTVYNTAYVEYSYNSGINMQTGRIRMITNGTTVMVDDITPTVLGSSNITFSGDILDGNVRLLYSTSNSTDGTFYYTIRAWYTATGI
jgi:hypothetical protein